MKVCLMTGGTGVIGEKIAEGIVKSGEYNLILLVRSKEKGENIVKQLGGENVSYMIADVSMKSSIYEFRKNWGDKTIDVLLNNAAVTPMERYETGEKIELQFATNVLGYYHMMNCFQDVIKGKIVNVASDLAGDLDMNDPEFKERKYECLSSYKASKQADRMLTKGFADRLKEKGIICNSCHPGVTASSLNKNLSVCLGGSKDGMTYNTPEECAATPLFLMFQQNELEKSGLYYNSCKVKKCEFQNNDEIEKLFKLCESY